MINAPIHLYDKGTWEAPAADTPGFPPPHAMLALDSARGAILEGQGWKLVDSWGVYLSPDRHTIVSVNLDDGALRRALPYVCHIVQ